MSAVKHAHEVLKMRRMAATQRRSTAGAGGGGGSSWVEGIAGIGGSMWKQGVKRLMPSSSLGATTQVVDALMQLKATDATKGYLYFDPKQLRADPSGCAVPPGRAPFEEAVVFMVGGGNYAEYQNLADHSRRSGRRVTYGCSELISPEGFLAHMASLGRGEGVAGGGGAGGK